MAVPRWQPGRLYQPNTVVQDVASGALANEQVTNSGFESGDASWTKGTGWTIENVVGFAGNWRAKFAPDGGTHNLVSDDRRSVDPGITRITARGFFETTGAGQVRIGIRWYNSGGGIIITNYLKDANGQNVWLGGDISGYRLQEVEARAPALAATASVVVQGTNITTEVHVDNVTWNYARLTPIAEVIYKAVQAAADFSGSSEPIWPTVIGNQVVDNGVTWEAVQANRVVWTCESLLTSGGSEPTWPTEANTFVVDNNIAWEANTRRVIDENCPNTKQVAILASKIFAGDSDIVGFSATVNPLDWTTANDAGYIPFGLNTYGSQPITALGIYRSNLVAWNAKAFQMWQVDEDPANFAILDAVPVGNPYYKSGSPVSNDLVWLTAEGIRSMGIAGASTNLQAGFFGKQIDPLVKAAIAAIGDNDDILSLFFPGAGQYWLIFGDEAFVLTISGGKEDMSWSRYEFPSAIDDWTISDTDLYLRSGEKVWKFDAAELVDDSGGEDVVFSGKVWWPYLDFGALGVTKSLIGFDVVADGEYTVSIGYNQNDDSQFTTPYTIDGDTLVGDIIPLPVSAPSLQLRLEFVGGAGDLNYDDVEVLLHLDGTDGDRVTTDSSKNAQTPSFVGGTDMTISSTQSKFGGTSLDAQFTGDAISVPDIAGLTLGTQDFTIEMWVYPISTTGANHYVNQSDGTTGGFAWELANNNGALSFNYSTNGSAFASFIEFSSAGVTGQWHHIAVVREGTSLTGYVDGIRVGSVHDIAALSIFNSDAALFVGCNNSAGSPGSFDANAFIDDVRITVGKARYSGASYTVPTAAFPDEGRASVAWEWSAAALHLKDFRRTS